MYKSKTPYQWLKLCNKEQCIHDTDVHDYKDKLKIYDILTYVGENHLTIRVKKTPYHLNW